MVRSLQSLRTNFLFVPSILLIRTLLQLGAGHARVALQMDGAERALAPVSQCNKLLCPIGADIVS
jgi:hypothetical protein